MLLRDFLKSPNIHKRVPHITEIKRTLDSNFKKHYNKNGKKFKFKSYKTDKSIYIIVKVPSETVDGILYDIVLQLTKKGSNESIFDYDIGIISNSPSFIYQHAYVYKQNKIITTNRNLLNAIPRKSLISKPTITNSYQVLLYEKTTFYALKYLFEMRKVNSNMVIESAINVEERDMQIVSFVDLMKRRKTLEKRQNVKKDKKKNKKITKKENDSKYTKESTKTQKTFTKTKTTNITKRIKKK